MQKHKLNARQKTFVEYTLLTHSYPTITDAYIAVYKPNGSRRTSSASASRIYNKPAVKEYRQHLGDLVTQKALENAESNRLFLLKCLGLT